MDVIINDFSLNGQFRDEEHFIESLYETTIPMFKLMEDINAVIIRSQDSYSFKVTKDKTLNDLFRIRGIPEITKLKGQLQKMFYEDPFWEDSIHSVEEIYFCKYTSKLSEFCLAEALEREIPVLSFEHPEFKQSTIEVVKNKNKLSIKNLYNKNISLEILRENGNITHFDFIMYKHSRNLVFDKKYFSEVVEKNSLSPTDISIILSDIDKLIDCIKSKTNPKRLSGPIEGKLKEFRTSLSNKREIRFFYFENGAIITFLNGFLKKTEKTPNLEIVKGKKNMERYI